MNSECYPIQLPNKKLFMSSAEGIDSELYDQYKMSFEKMMCGDPNYFVCDIDCEQSIYPKKDGKPFKSLVTKETVEQAMATNPYKATREYYNKFDRDGGTDNLVKRSTLEKLSQAYLPSFKNEDNNKKYVITYDPASRIDNSVILIGEFFRDEEKGWMAKIVHCVNLIEILENGEKVVIQKPEQIKILKDLILAYNGKVPDYENLLKVMIDGGSGGGGFEVAQEILPEWKGRDGRIHRGFIDLENEHMKKRENDYVGNCLNLEIFNFTKNKVRAYESTQNMINQGLMIFPKSPNIRGELENEITNADGSVALKYDKLSAKEFNAWNQVDLLKEELIAMQKAEKNNKTIQFEISHEKKLQNMHDDHSDCCAMMCDYLARLRADDVLDVEKGNSSYDVIFNSITEKNNNNPFNNMGNPFAGLSSKNPFL